LSANSRPTMRAALAAAAYILTGEASGANELHLPWHRLRHDDMRMLRLGLAERYAPTTVNRILAAVRGVLRACQTLGYISVEQCMKASNIPPVPSYRIPGEQDEDVPAIYAILEVCNTDPRPTGRRDAALLALLYGAGLRSSEIVNLDLGDYSPAARTLTIRQGNATVNYQLSVSSGIAGVLHRWLLIRGLESGPFFVPISKSGRLQPRQLTTRAIAWILRRRSRAADVLPFSPRELRRSHLLSLNPVFIKWTS
jgi:integrase